jgi:hypothetical protein
MSERDNPTPTPSVPVTRSMSRVQTPNRPAWPQRAGGARDTTSRPPTRIYRLRATFAVNGNEQQVRAFAAELDRILERAYPDGSTQVELRTPGGAAQVELEVQDATFHNGGKGWYAIQPLVALAGTHAGVRIDAGDKPSLAVDVV